MQMSSFTLSAFGDEIDQSLEKQIEVLKQHGISHLEVRGINGKNIADYTVDEIRPIKLQLDANGIKISAIGSPIGKIKITDPFQPHYEKFLNVMELAHELETKYIRVFSFFIPEGEEANKYKDEVISRMAKLIAAAKAKGLVLLHENEKDIYGDTADRCLTLFQELACESFRGIFDPANFVQCGVETFPKAFEMLKPYIDYMHIKDATYSSGGVVPAGQGDGKVKEILMRLKTNNFRGFLSLEPHLGAFKGLGDLELDDKWKDLPDGGPKLFAIAVKALKEILNSIEGEVE